jgi:hypothetical protein
MASAMALTVAGRLLRNDKIIQIAAFIFIWGLGFAPTLHVKRCIQVKRRTRFHFFP